jgi:hypothetical protein
MEVMGGRRARESKIKKSPQKIIKSKGVMLKVGWFFICRLNIPSNQC